MATPTADLDVKELARSEARRVLADSTTFARLNRDQQFSFYQEVLKNINERFAGMPETTLRSLAMDAPPPQRASDLINDKRLENRRIEQAGGLAADFIHQVDFPGFVRDLLKGVFDANITVMHAQMDDYLRLLKEASKDIGEFIKNIKDDAAFGYLAEHNSDQFGMIPDGDDADGQPKMALTDKDGNHLNKEDVEVRTKIMDAKIAMAKEQRAMLREMILMGVTRLVVEKGIVKASVLYDIKVKEDIRKKDRAALKDASSSSSSFDGSSGGLIGKLIGGFGGGTTNSSQHTQISVSTANSKNTTDLEVKLAGSVEINFKTDYFKLDNFATMYGPVTPADRASANAALPAASH